MSQTLISSRGLSVRFGDEQVFRQLSFDIPVQQHTVFKGESGSGKSTLMKILLGFLTPSSGELHHAENEATFLRRKTAWLPQDINLGEGTVMEVVMKPFEFKANSSHRPTRQEIADAITALGLATEDLSKQFRNLSTGQRQRVGLAICHLLNKPVLMLDEPTSSLDAVSKQKAVNLLLSDANKTVISTSHDPFWVDQADNVIELS